MVEIFDHTPYVAGGTHGLYFRTLGVYGIFFMTITVVAILVGGGVLGNPGNGGPSESNRAAIG